MTRTTADSDTDRTHRAAVAPDVRPKRGRKAAGRRDEPAPASGRQPVKKAPAKKDAALVGAEPRAHLLPPEVVADRRAAVVRRRLALGVVGVLVVVVLGTLGATSTAANARAELASEQAATQQILKQELTYVKVRSVQDHVDLIQTAQQVGASTEIAWMPYLQKVQATLPPSVVITGVNVDSSTPITLYPQSTASLQGPRVATIVFTAQSPSLPEVPSWLLALKTLPGYADALPGSVTLEPSGAYTVTITMHVNDQAFSKRLSPKKGK
jgi:hypothetical protein